VSPPALFLPDTRTPSDGQSVRPVFVVRGAMRVSGQKGRRAAR
jgi:hypothetical protein